VARSAAPTAIPVASRPRDRPRGTETPAFWKREAKLYVVRVSKGFLPS